MDHKGPLLVMLLYVALAMFAPRLSLADERQKDEMEAKAILMDILSSESPLASYEACKVTFFLVRTAEVALTARSTRK